MSTRLYSSSLRGAEDHAQAGALEAELAAQGVLEVALVGGRDQVGVVDEEDEGRRLRARLGDVEELEALLAGDGAAAGGRWRRA